VVSERIVRRALIVMALLGLAAGVVAYASGKGPLAHWIWAAATVPVVIALAVSITRDLLQGRMGVDAIAFLSMTAALALGQSLAGIVVAIMYAGGTVLEDFAVTRAERSLRSLVDRAPRIAHRRLAQSVEDVPVDEVKIDDTILVRAGEIVPVDGLIASVSAMIDESALTGEPIPVTRLEKDEVRSGTLNAGETSMRATATAGESTYAGIVRLVTAAQTAKSPFIRTPSSCSQ
jgi:cation transport ATPase